MGSFSVACGISKIPIGSDDPVVYIPLELSERIKFEKVLNGGRHYLVYPYSLYQPLTLPIIGYYDGCGNIESIEINDNIRLIERYFNIPIENFLDINEQPRKIHSVMFIHKRIYDFLINNSIDDFGERRSVYRIRESYSNCYDRMNTSLNTVDDLYKKCLELYQEGYTEEQRSVILKSLINSKEFKNPFNLDNRESLSKTFKKIYKSAVKNKLLKNQFIDFEILNINMFSTNSYYSPTLCGEQYGNYFAMKDLYNETLKITEENIQERGYE